MSQTQEVSWPAKHLREGLEKSWFILFRDLSCWLGWRNMGEKREKRRLQNPPDMEQTQRMWRGGKSFMDTSAAGWEAAGLALGNASKGSREEKPQSLNPKCDTVFQMQWSWRGSVPRNAAATTNTWPYTGKGESELLFSAT